MTREKKKIKNIIKNGREAEIEAQKCRKDLQKYLREEKRNIDCDKSEKLIRCAEGIYDVFMLYHLNVQGIYRDIKILEDEGCFNRTRYIRQTLSKSVSFNNRLVKKTEYRSENILRTIISFGSYIIEKCPSIIYNKIILARQDGYSSKKCDRRPITGFKNLKNCVNTLQVLPIPYQDIKMAVEEVQNKKNAFTNHNFNNSTPNNMLYFPLQCAIGGIVDNVMRNMSLIN